MVVLGLLAGFAVLAQAIKVDLKLTDFQLGLAQGLAFAPYPYFGCTIMSR